jgi:hypothetical protein
MSQGLLDFRFHGRDGQGEFFRVNDGEDWDYSQDVVVRPIFLRVFCPCLEPKIDPKICLTTFSFSSIFHSSYLPS